METSRLMPALLRYDEPCATAPISQPVPSRQRLRLNDGRQADGEQPQRRPRRRCRLSVACAERHSVETLARRTSSTRAGWTIERRTLVSAAALGHHPSSSPSTLAPPAARKQMASERSGRGGRRPNRTLTSCAPKQICNSASRPALLVETHPRHGSLVAVRLVRSLDAVNQAGPESACCHRQLAHRITSLECGATSWQRQATHRRITLAGLRLGSRLHNELQLWKSGPQRKERGFFKLKVGRRHARHQSRTEDGKGIPLLTCARRELPIWAQSMPLSW